jgi:hypothetical protein
MDFATSIENGAGLSSRGASVEGSPVDYSRKDRTRQKLMIMKLLLFLCTILLDSSLFFRDDHQFHVIFSAIGLSRGNPPTEKQRLKAMFSEKII